MIKRYHVIYQGQVQGVGFRYHLCQLARLYNLTGFCQNLDNGNVLCEIQGEDVEEFLLKSLRPSYFIEVRDYSYKEIKVDNQESSFSVIY